MIYFKSVIAGIVASVAALILFGVIIAAGYRGQGMIGINIAGPLPLAIMAIAFAAGFYLVFKFSK